MHENYTIYEKEICRGPEITELTWPYNNSEYCVGDLISLSWHNLDSLDVSFEVYFGETNPPEVCKRIKELVDGKLNQRVNEAEEFDQEFDAFLNEVDEQDGE